LEAATNGRFEIYGSKIFSNYAMQNPLGQIMISDVVSIIDGTEIYNNEAITISGIKNELTS